MEKEDLKQFQMLLVNNNKVFGKQLKNEIQDGFRKELKQEINGVKTELKKEINGVKTELKQEISGVKTELKQEISGIRTEFNQKFKGIHHEIGKLRTEMKTMDKNIRTDLRKEMQTLTNNLRSEVVVGVADFVNTNVLPMLNLYPTRHEVNCTTDMKLENLRHYMEEKS